jgi:hypothetical protein
MEILGYKAENKIIETTMDKLKDIQNNLPQSWKIW